MERGAHVFEGGCHCGNLAYVFEASAPLETLGLRADMCGFCRAHGARNTSDPHGAMRIRGREPAKLVRYRFALRTADFLLCAACGVYIGALLTDGGKAWFTVNANSFRTPPPPGFPAAPQDFDAEDVPTRIARRKARWTPVTEFLA
ncbi:MAG: aldehyde-activating protein [Rhizomicrobium sp.]